MDVILLNDNDITSNTLLGGNIDIDKYRFCILDAQTSKLEEILGETLYEKIQADFDSNTLSGQYLILHEKYIVPFLIHQSALEYLLIGAYTVGNAGIFKVTPQNGTPVEKTEVDFLVNNQRNKAEMYENRLKNWLINANISEFYTYVNGKVNAKIDNNQGGWYFN